MKKSRLLIIPAVAVLLLIIFISFNTRQNPVWETRLNHYLSFLRSSGEPSYQVVTAVPASQPSNFSPTMSTGSFSESALFMTTLSNDVQSFSSLEPLPYPPEQVWCVLLKDNVQEQLVFVALHNNLYNADWIVHIPPDPWGSPAIQSTLSAIGCSIQ